MSIVPAAKRQKTGNELVPADGNAKAIISTSRPRKSGLFAEVMLLTGHEGPINSVKFSPKGQVLASAGHDKQVFLWEVYGETPQNFAVMGGHKKDILDLHWSADGSKIFSASADKTLVCWDAETASRIKKMADHESHVNACCAVRRGPELVCSGSDDCTAKLWDVRTRGSVASFAHEFQVTAVCFSDQGDQIITGGIDNTLRVWDIRKKEVVLEMAGHTDTITGLSLSPDGSFVLSNCMDCYLRVWDVRPFCAGERCVKVFMGHQHNLEKLLLRCAWAPDGKQVSCGSSDKFVNVWDTASRQLKFRLPGHQGIVTEVDFHPTEPIIASCARDKQIFLGELQ